MKKITLKKGWISKTIDGLLWFKDKPEVSKSGVEGSGWEDFSFLESDLEYHCLIEITQDFFYDGKIEFLSGKWLDNLPMRTELGGHEGAYIKRKPVELEAKNITTNVAEADTVEELIDLLIKTDTKDLPVFIAEYCELAQLENIIVNDLRDECDEEEVYNSNAFDSHFYSLQSEVYKYWEIRKELITDMERAYDESLQIFQANMKDNFDI